MTFWSSRRCLPFFGKRFLEGIMRIFFPKMTGLSTTFSSVKSMTSLFLSSIILNLECCYAESKRQQQSLALPRTLFPGVQSFFLAPQAVVELAATYLNLFQQILAFLTLRRTPFEG
jgi:hypothetical protein